MRDNPRESTHRGTTLASMCSAGWTMSTGLRREVGYRADTLLTRFQMDQPGRTNGLDAYTLRSYHGNDTVRLLPHSSSAAGTDLLIQLRDSMTLSS
jgi:hypothetical protein